MFEADPHAPPLPVPSRNNSARTQTPSHGHRTPSPPDQPDEPETIHPIPIRHSPNLPAHHINVPPDGWIPTADSRTSYIAVPPPHELQQPFPPSPSSVATEIQDSRPTHQQEPTPVPPPVRTRDYAYQASVPPPIPIQRTSSLASRTSTHISQYDLVNKRPGSALRNEIYVGRARSGSQPSRDNSMSRNEHRDQERERRYSDRTEAESIVEQWRADSDVASSPRNPPRPSVSVLSITGSPTLMLGLCGPKDASRTFAPTFALLLPTEGDCDAHTPRGRRRRSTGSHAGPDRTYGSTPSIATRRPRLPARTRPITARLPPPALPSTSILGEQHPQHRRRVAGEHFRTRNVHPTHVCACYACM